MTYGTATASDGAGEFFAGSVTFCDIVLFQGAIRPPRAHRFNPPTRPHGRAGHAHPLTTILRHGDRFDPEYRRRRPVRGTGLLPVDGGGGAGRQRSCASVRHTDAPSGLPRVLSWLGRLSCRNTGSHLNGRHPRPVNAYSFPARRHHMHANAYIAGTTKKTGASTSR